MHCREALGDLPKPLCPAGPVPHAFDMQLVILPGMIVKHVYIRRPRGTRGHQACCEQWGNLGFLVILGPPQILGFYYYYFFLFFF